MDYVEVTYIVAPKDPWADILIAQLADIGFDSFEETENGFKGYIEGKLFSEDAIKEASQFSDNPKVDISYNVKKIDDTNWNQVWESNFEPVHIEDCYIRAPFHEEKKGITYELIIEPKMSFGPGHHETTSLMVKWLLEIDFKDKTVLDMGCGTGVLAILAEKRGAKTLTAIDNYIYAYENTIENVERNNCKNIEVILGDATALGKQKFDIIIANITRNVLLEDMESYSKVLNQSGLILFSGFFSIDKSLIEDKATSLGLEHVGEKLEKEWISLCFKKK
ncbi:MAG: 50S ribosomal protein L11 methyltransferase [Bacteroidetes bacterium]|nr:50S ribosomal protein L11 methyltransferase [Bacteroidota bacterium]